MRFIFLGTGTSAGIPVIACDCQTCRSDDPRDRRTRTGAALAWTDPQGRERVVLLDATPDLREQALRHDLRRCDAILFTHNHVDHLWGLDETRRFNAVMDDPIDIYAETATMDSLRRVYKHIFDSRTNVNQSFVADLIPHGLSVGEPVDLFGVRFTPMRLLHGRLPILGFRIEPASVEVKTSGVGGTALRAGGTGVSPVSKEMSEAQHSTAQRPVPPHTPVPPKTSTTGATPAPLKSPAFLPLAYCTDVSSIPTETWPALQGVRTLVLDALRRRHHPTHLTVNQAVRIAEEVGAERTWFVHMGHQLKHAETDERLPTGMGLAYDGLVLE